MDFPLYFQKVIWPGGGAFFEPKKISEKAKLPGMCPSFAGNVGETQFHQCPFIPPSYIEAKRQVGPLEKKQIPTEQTKKKKGLFPLGAK